MNQIENRANSITDGVIWKGLLAFFFPILLGTLFQQLYNTVDTVVVGRFGSKQALAAVGGSAAQILNLIIGFFAGISSGATVIVSQYYGAQDDEGVSRTVHTGMAIAILGGALMTLIGLICAPTLLEWMDTPEDTMAESVEYLRIVFLSMIPAMIYNVGSGILRAVGDSKRPLYFLIICCMVNVVLDLAFVLLLHMGVAGVAIATSLAQLISAVLVIVWLKRSKESYRLEMRKIRADRRMSGEIVRIGLPSGLQSVMFSFSNMLITASVNGFGTSTVAAWVALGKVDAFNWLIVSAFGLSVTTFVGQNYGARRYDRVEKSMLVCLGLSLVMSLLFSLSFALFGRTIFQLFTTEADVLEIAMDMMRFMVCCYWMYLPIEIISGTMRGTGNVFVPTAITAVGICALRVVWMLLVVPNWHTIQAVMFSYPSTWVLTSAAFIVYYFKIRRRMLRLPPKA